MSYQDDFLRAMGASPMQVWAMQSGAPFPTDYCGGPRDGERALVDPAMNAAGRFHVNATGDAWYRWDASSSRFVWHVEENA